MFVGVVLISGVVGSGAYGDDPLLGVVFGVLTAITYALFILILRQGNADDRRPAGPLFDATLSGAVFSAIGGIIVGDIDWTPGLESQAWLVLLALSSQVLGWLLISVSLPRLPAVLTSIVLMLQPVTTVFLGALLLSEAPSGVQLLGVAIVIAGVAVATLKPRARDPAPVLSLLARGTRLGRGGWPGVGLRGRPGSKQGAAEAELAAEREVGVEDLPVVARRDHSGLVALPAVGRDARHPAAPVWLGEQGVWRPAQQRVELDERAADGRSNGHGAARAPLHGGERLTHVHAIDRPVLDLRRVPEHLPQRSRDAHGRDAVLDPRPDVAAGKVLAVGWKCEAGGRGGGDDRDLTHETRA